MMLCAYALEKVLVQNVPQLNNYRRVLVKDLAELGSLQKDLEHNAIFVQDFNPASVSQRPPSQYLKQPRADIADKIFEIDQKQTQIDRRVRGFAQSLEMYNLFLSFKQQKIPVPNFEWASRVYVELGLSKLFDYEYKRIKFNVDTALKINHTNEMRILLDNYGYTCKKCPFKPGACKEQLIVDKVYLPTGTD